MFASEAPYEIACLGLPRPNAESGKVHFEWVPSTSTFEPLFFLTVGYENVLIHRQEISALELLDTQSCEGQLSPLAGLGFETQHPQFR